MSDEYRIPISFGDFNNTLQNVYSDFDKTKAKIEGNLIKLRVASDQNDLKKIESDIKNIKNKPGEILLDIDTGTLKKQLDLLPKWMNQNGAKVGKQFREQVQQGLQGQNGESNLFGIKELVASKTDYKRMSKGAAKEVLSQLQTEMNAPINSDNYLDILKQAEAMEQLLAVVKELNGMDAYKDVASGMGLKQTDLEKQITARYTQMGKILADSHFTDSFVDQINKAFEMLQSNLDALYKSLSQTIQELGTGLSGTGTGTGNGNGVGGNISEAVQNELDALEKEIEDANKKIQETKEKIEKLKQNSKIATSEDLNKMIKDYEDNSYKWNADNTTKKEKEMYDIMNQRLAQGQKLTKAQKEYYDIWKKQFPEFKEDSSGSTFKESSLKVNEQAIKDQELLLSQLQSKLEGLQEKRKKIIENAQAGISDNSVAGTTGGSGNKGTSSQGDEQTASVAVEPDASDFIQKIKDQLSGQFVEVDVKPSVDGFLDTIKQQIASGVDLKINGVTNNGQNVRQLLGYWDNNPSYNERGAYINSRNGYSSVSVSGTNSRLIKDSDLSKSLQFAQQMNEVVDTLIHTHPETSVAALSMEDIDTGISHISDGIKYVVAKAGDQIAKIDVSQLVEDGIDLKQLENKRKQISNGYLSEDAARIGYEDIVNTFQDQLRDTVKQSLIENFTGSSLDINNSDIVHQIDQFVDDAISQITKSAESGEYVENGNMINQALLKIVDDFIAKLNLDENNKYDIDGRIGDAFDDILYDKMSGVVDTKREQLHANVDQMQKYSQKALFEAFKEIGVDPNKYYAIQSQDDYLKSMGFSDGDNAFNIDINPSNVRKSIQDALSEPFDIDVNPKLSKDTSLDLSELKTSFEKEEQFSSSSADNEGNFLSELSSSVNNVTDAVDRKTEAFRQEAQTVSGVVDGEVSSLDALLGEIILIADEVKDLDKLLKELGTGANFDNFISSIKENKEALKDFADILRKTKEEQEQAKKNASDTANEKKKNGYDDKEMKRRAKLIEEEADRLRKGFDSDEVVTNLQRMYDSHGNLVQAILTTEKDIHDDDEKMLSKQTEKFNIHWDKTGNELYSSLMTTDDYKKVQEQRRKELLQYDQKVAQERESNNKKVYADYLRQQAKEQKDIEKQRNERLNDDLKSIEAFGKANTEVQNIKSDSLTGKITGEQMSSQLDQVIQAAEKAKEAIKDLFKMYKSGDISKDDFKEALAKYKSDDIQIGDAKSRDKYLNTVAQTYDKLMRKSFDNDYMSETDIENYNRVVKVVDEINEKKRNGIVLSESENEVLQKISATNAELAQKARDNENQKRRQEAEKQAQAQSKAQEQSAKAQADSLKEQQKMIDELAESYEKLYKLENDYASGKNVNQTQSEIDALKKRNAEIRGRIDWINMSDENTKKINNAREDYISKKTNDAINERGNKISGDVKEAIKEYKNAAKEYAKNYTDWQKGILPDSININRQGYQLVDLYDKLKEKQNDLKQAQADGATGLEDQAEELRKILEITKQSIEANVQSSNQRSRLKSVNTMIETMEKQRGWRLGGQEPGGLWDEEINKAKAELEELRTFDFSQNDSLAKFEERYNQIVARIKASMKDSEFLPVRDEWQASMSSRLENWANTNKIAAKEFAEELDNLRNAIKEVDSEADAVNVENMFKEMDAEAANKHLLGKSLGDRFKDQFKNTMTSLATYYLSFQDFIRYGREAIQTVTELDTQLTEMRKVSNESLSTLQNYQLETFDIADRVGTTAAQISASTADWMRLGENLQQAKKSAEYSTMLLNVSEFGDIGAATESLVAMSQAYQEIDKIDIIDKLNNIGNNFSISTSELAQSLQRSAGTLKVAGNTIDEAIALTVAGNQVLQNPQMVGQSLRTIALRLTGTSIQDMQEAGEEIDGLITTQSKLRATIMDATKVQSNGFQGFDILNENGNYKTTFEMLKGIAAVWKEIGEEDRKMGTNRQSFLLETIAGKTRAAAASSILDNFETLQDVYEASLQSEGSAQQELDKYLDSIQGKAAQFKNALQELTASAIDSSWIKGFIDLGTQLLNVINNLGDAFGHLNSLISTGVGIFLQANGKGLLNFNKMVGNGTLNTNSFVGSIGSFIKNLKPQGLSKELKNIFTEENMHRDLGELIETEGIDITAKGFQGLEQFADEQGKIAFGAYECEEALNALSSGASRLGSSFLTLKKFGINALSVIGNTAIIMVAVKGFELLATGIYRAATAQKRWIEEGKQSVQTMNEIRDSYNGAKKIVDEFDEDKFFNLQKKSERDELSIDEYEEYARVSNELANIFPSLVSGFDEQGNAIVNLGSNAEEAGNKLSILLQQERELAAFEISENLGKAVKGVQTRVNQLNKDIDNQQNIIDTFGPLKNELSKFKNNLISSGLTTFDVELDTEDSELKYKMAQIATMYEAALSENGIFYNTPIIEDGRYYIEPVIDDIDESQLKKAQQDFMQKLEQSEFSDIVSEEFLNATKIKSADEKEIKAEWNSLVPSLISSLELYDEWDQLSADLQQNIRNSITDLDFAKLSKDVRGEFADDPRLFIRKMFLDPIYDSMLDSKGEIDETKENLFGQLLKFDGSKMTNEEYKKSVNDIVNQISDDTEVRKQIKVILGFQYEDENGNHWDITKRRNNLFEAFGGDVESRLNKSNNISWKKFIGLTQQDFSAIEYARDNMAVDLGTIKSWDKLIDVIQKAKEKMQESTKIKADGTLAELFNDESYSSNVEGYEKHLSSLTSALETLRAEGSLTAEQMRDLQEEFPDLTDFSEEGISKFGAKELSSWIDEFKSGWTDFSDEGVKQLDTYLANFTASYRKISVSEQDALTKVRESFITAPAYDNEERMAQAEQLNEKLNALKEKYGEDLNWNIVLALQDQFSEDVDTLIEKYDDYKLVWDLEVETEDLQKTIDSLTADRNLNSSKQGLNEAIGKAMTIEDYENDNAISDGLIKAYEGQLRRTREALVKSPENVALQNKVKELEGLIFGEEANKRKNRLEELKLPRKQFENIGTELARATSEAERQIQNVQNVGNVPTQTMYQAAIDSASAEKANLERTRQEILDEATQFEELQKKEFISNNNFRSQEQADAAWASQKSSILAQNPEWQQFMSDLDANQGSIDATIDKIRDWGKAIDELPLTKLQTIGAELSRATSAAENEIANRQSLGGTATKQMYQTAIDAAQAEKANLALQQQDILNRQDAFKREFAATHQFESKSQFDEALANNADWKQLQENFDSTGASIDGLTQKIYDWNNAIQTMSFSELEHSGNEIQKSLDRAQAEFEKREPSASGYLNLMGLNEENIENLEEQIHRRKVQLQEAMNDGSIAYGSDAYYEATDVISGLEDQLISARDAQTNFAQSLLELPGVQAANAIQKYKDALEELQSQQEYNATRGIQMTDEDYEKNIQNYTKQIIGGNVLKTIYGAEEAFYSGLYGANSEQAQTARSNKQSVIQDIFGALTGRYNTQKERNELPVKQAEQELSRLQSQADILQSQFDQLESSGVKITNDRYQEMADSYDGIIEQARIVRDGYYNLRNDVDMQNVDGSLNTEWITYNEQWVQASTALDGYIAKQREFNQAQKELPLNDLKNNLTSIQSEATNIENELSNAETLHKKTSEDLYKSLISNGNKQIKNLRDQKTELYKLQSETQRGSSKWREYQDQIDSVDQSINDMQMNQVGWFETMTSLVSSNASELASVLSSAFSEMNSETGLTIDTMNELSRQFSDLVGYDVSSIFYETADGMKFNVEAAENLVEAEYQLQTSNLKDTIEEQKRIIELYGDSETETAQKAVAAANQRIDAAQRELSMLQALYDQQKQQFSDFQQWQNAESTANAGDRYNTIQSAIKGMKEAREKGLTGTDEFQAFTSMIDEWGVDTVAAFDKNISMIEKYFTEDASGLGKFFKDAVDKGFGTYSDENGYALNIPDVTEFGHEMGLSQEMVDILLGRAEDYGVYNDWVNTRLDGEEKVKEKMEEVADAQLKLNQMMRDGASDEDIASQRQVVNELKQRQANLEANTEIVGSREGMVTASELRAGVQDVRLLNRMRARGEIDQDTFERKVQQVADETHVKITPDFKVDTKAMQEAFPEWQVEIKPFVDPDWSLLGDTTDNSAAQKMQEGWETNKDVLNENLTTLQNLGLTYEELGKINLDDGKYDQEDNAQLVQAEQALDNIKNTLGLNVEEAAQLVSLFQQLNLLQPQEDTAYDTSTSTTTGNEIDNTRREQLSLRQINNPEAAQAQLQAQTQQITQVVTSKYMDGAITPEELQNMSLETFNTTFNVEVEGEEQLQQVKDSVAELSAADGFDMVVKLDQSSISALTTTDKTVNVDTSDAQKSVDDISNAIENIPDGNPSVEVGGNYEEAKGSIRELGSSIDMLHSATPQVDVTGNFDAAKDSIRALSSNIDMLHDKTVTVTVNRVGGSADSLGGQNNLGGSALASGNVSSRKLSERMSETLVGEEGPELRATREGYWDLLGQNGPEFRDDISSSDIVFNKDQTLRLLKNGHINTRGKALMGGSQKITGPAALDRAATKTKGFTSYSANTIEKAAGAVKDATKSTKAATAAKDKETKATENTTTALEKFQNWASSFMDWIEVRINRFTQRMELNLSKMENAVGFSTKNDFVDKAMADNNVVLETSQKAISKNGGYTNHLKKVVSKAKSAKLVTKKEAERLIGLIEEGGLTVEDFSKYLKNKKNKNGSDSSKTENRATAFINEYQTWYEKILNCQDGIEQCIAKNKELEQTKLDNIKDEYESLASYIESINATSQATISLHQTLGYDERYGTAQGNETRQQYQAQINNQRAISTILQNEVFAFQNELQNAANIFGVDSIQYREAETALQGMNKALIESQANVKELTRQLYDLNLKPMEYALNRLQAAGQRFADIVSLKQARGTIKNDPSSILTEANFTDQIYNANSQIAQLTQRMEYNKRIQDDLDYATDSEKWDQLQSAIDADEHSIAQLMITNEQLKDSIREMRWKPFEDLQKQLSNNIADFDHLRGLFNEEEFFDDDGEGWDLTKEGKANIALLGAQMMTTREQIADYRYALEKLDEELDNHVISQEEYDEQSRNMVETIQKLVESNENYKDSLVDLYKTQISNEEAALQKLITARKEALSQKKAYYDYDKSLKSQNKELNMLKAQQNALMGVSNAQAKAQQARLAAQIKEKQDELDDTRYNHRYDLLNQGYDKLSEDSQEALDKTLRHVAANAQAQEQIVEQMLSKIAGQYDEAYETIQQRISDTGTVVGDTAEACLKSQQLNDFFETINTSTLVPKDNWDTFMSAVLEPINTSAIQDYVNQAGELLDTAIQKAKDYANALADAANAQSSITSDNGNTTSNNTPSTDSSSSTGDPATDAYIQQQQSLLLNTDDSNPYLDWLRKNATPRDKSKTNKDYNELRNFLISKWGYDIGDWKSHSSKYKTFGKMLGVTYRKNEDYKEYAKRVKKALKARKYKRGTLGTLSDELAWTHEGEIIRRSDGAILRQLPAGTQVIPKIASENLLKWAQIDPFKSLKDGMAASGQVTNMSNNNAPVIYYDSIIHVDGNVDADMMDKLGDIASGLLKDRNFMQKQFDYNTQNFKRAYNKRA